MINKKNTDSINIDFSFEALKKGHFIKLPNLRESVKSVDKCFCSSKNLRESVKSVDKNAFAVAPWVYAP